MVVDGTGMDGNVVADGNVAANVRGTCIKGHMDTGTVLHVGTVADGNGCHIATYHSIEPYRALVAHGDVAHNSGILAEIAVFTPFRAKTFITLNQSHIDL